MSTRSTYPTDLRQIVNVILYQAKTGCQWRMLPHDFPPEGTVRDYFRRFKRNKVLENTNDELRNEFVFKQDAMPSRVWQSLIVKVSKRHQRQVNEALTVEKKSTA